jgi:hypothetical protein
MAGDDPKATDKAVVACLPPSVRSYLKADYHTRFPKEGGCKVEFRGYQLMRPLSEEERAQCRVVLDLANASAEPIEILKLLTRLKHMTISAAQDEQDIAAQMVCYAEELSKYPADIVRHVLQTQPNQSKFWPAWSEISSRIVTLDRERRLKRKALT